MSTKFEKRQLPDTTVYTDEVNTFTEKIYIPEVLPTEDAEAINLKFFNEQKTEIDNEIQLLKNPDRITQNTGFTLVGQDLTLNPFWKGVIDGVEYSNPILQVINLPLSTATNTRADIIVLTKNNDFIRVQGVESTTNPPIPATPNDTLLAVTVIVNDSSVGDITNPISGDAYVKKIEFGNVLLTGSGVINQLNLTDEKATVVFKGSITRLNTISYASVPYNGKRITLFNAQATPVVIGNAVSGYGVDFVFPDAQDYILLPNQTIEFSFDITYAPYAHHMLIGAGGGSQDLQSVLDNGQYAEFDGTSNLRLMESDGSGGREFAVNISDGIGNATQFLSTADSIQIVKNTSSGTTILTILEPVAFTTILLPSKLISGTYTIATTDDLDDQIEVGINQSVNTLWNNKTILFTANCVITVPSTLLAKYGFVFRTLAGVTVTWAITAPFTWETTPSTTPEKTTGSFMRRGSTNIILLDF